VARLREWRPDVIYAHGLRQPLLEKAVQAVAPAVLLAHNYYGTCISGSRAHQFPAVRPCERRFGATCLLHFYPRRCGGLNPRTMWRQFRTQRQRFQLLVRYRAVVTLSEHIRREYLRHGVPEDRVVRIRPCIQQRASPREEEAVATPPTSWRVLFCGRMDRLKGAHVLLRAAAELPRRLGRSVHLTFAGDGPERAALEDLARAHSPGLHVAFLGWVGQERLSELLRETHLLAVPSLWPEPFGLVGLEAALYGVPAVAFAVGGIPEWLHDGVNGCLALGAPATAEGLAGAAVSCLGDLDRYARLRRGAWAEAQRYRPADHVAALSPILENAAGTACPTGCLA
jgi:glycosyltransferase involved in cell wall biosynthesis